MKRDKHLARLRRIYADIPDSKKDKAEIYLEKASEVLELMDDCLAHVADEGSVTEMSQGKYSIMRQNPWQKSYTDNYKTMLSTLDKLNKMSAGGGLQKDELEAFLDDDAG